MKNLKVNWTALLAIAVAVSVVSCANEHFDQQKKEIYRNNFIQSEQKFEEIRENFDNVELEKIVIPEGLDIENTNINAEEAGYSK